MTPIQQMLYLTRHDLMRLRAWMLCYVALSVLVTLIAMDVVLFDQRASALAPLLWLAGGLIAAFAVQSDSPVRANAFWVGRPISARAMLGAKLCLALLLLLPPGVGMAFMLAHYGIEAQRMIAPLCYALWLYAAWILIVMTLAAYTTRFATLIGVLVAVPTVQLVVTLAISSRPWSALRNTDSPMTLGLLATIGALALLVTAYARRQTSGVWVTGAAGVATLGMLSAISSSSARAARVEAAVASPAPVRIMMDALEVGPLTGAWSRQLSFTAAGMNPGLRYLLTLDTVRVTGVNGVTTQHSAYGYGEFAKVSANAILPGWMPGTDSASIGSFMVPVTELGMDTLGGAVRSVAARGVLDVAESRVIAAVRATGDTVLTERRQQLHLRGFRVAEGAGSASLEITGVYDDASNTEQIWKPMNRYRVRVVWPSTGDTLLLTTRNMTVAQQVSVLPGVSAHRMQMRLDVSNKTVANAAYPPLSDAVLELVEWNTIGRYRAGAEQSLAASAPRSAPSAPSPASPSSPVPLRLPTPR